MALDFHRLDNQDYLFSLDDKKYDNLDEIFATYKNWTGTYIDQYGDTKLTVQNQKALIKIIDTYIEHTNLNLDKQKTVDVVEFRALMVYFSEKNINIEILGD